MKMLRAQAPVGAFTLIELLAVIIIFFIIVGMMLPHSPGKSRAMSAACVNNQKEINLGFHMWASDNGDKFPWQMTTNGGSMDLINNNLAVSQFLPLTYLRFSPNVFVCPSDKVKSAAADIDTLSNSNLSYFVNVDTPFMSPATMILTGDRHLEANNSPVKPGQFGYTNGMAMSWTSELHPTSMAGMVSFADGHVEGVSAARDALTAVFKRQSVASERLLVP